MKKTIFSVVITVFIMAMFSVVAFADGIDVSYFADVDDVNTEVNVQMQKGESYFFLPSAADLNELVLDFGDKESVTVTGEKGSVEVKNGEAFDLTSLFNGVKDKYKVTFSVDGEELTVVIMHSAKIRSMHIVSNDPVNKGRNWVEKNKENKATGLVSIIGVDGEADYAGELTQIKGRGNSTFYHNKKPYQIKIAEKTDIINNDSSQASKTWVLLANFVDYSFIRNSVTFSLAEKIGLAYTPKNENVDLYYDGEYRGTYLLSEKTETGKARVDIDDLDSMIEEVNEGNDAYENPVVVVATTSSNGNTAAAEDSKGSYKYVKGLAEPSYAEGTTHHAFLLELELSNRYPDEQSGFVTKNGQCVVTKNPEYLTKDTGAYISRFWQDFETAVYSKNGYNTSTGKYYYEYCDLDSLVKLYLINELAKNQDGFRSSTYFYLPADSDIMYAGPVWDYDKCYGSTYSNAENTGNPENFYMTERYLIDALLKIESFRNEVKKALDSKNGYFYKAVKEITAENGAVDEQYALLEQSQKMNCAMWDSDSERLVVVKAGAEKNYKNSVEFFRDYMNVRVDWLSSQTAGWNGDDYTLETDEGNKELSFFEKIAEFFRSIIEWFRSLFGMN